MQASRTGCSLMLVAACMSLGACSSIRLPSIASPTMAAEPVTEPLPELIVDLPEQFAASEASGPYQALAWWESFADPALNRVVEAVLASNYDLARAVARVDQARARARIANAVTAPLINPAAGVVDLDLPTNAGIGAQLEELELGSALEEQFGLMLPDRLGVTTYTFGAEFAYEMDFWGRQRNQRLAAGAEQLASEADLVAARIAVLAETVRTYLELVNLRQQRILAGQNIDILNQQQLLAQARYASGLLELPALYGSRRQLRDARARLAQLEAGLAEAASRLWILLGGYQADIDTLLPDTLRIADSAAPVPAGIPANLLTQRPDVASARQRVDAARFALGARRAALLPTLSLSGSIGLQATAAGDWFDPNQWFSNLGVNLLGPVLQGSRLQDNVELAQARLAEATANWGHAVVTAVHEVEAALTGLAAERRRHQILLAYLAEAESEAQLRQQRYTAGIGSYEAVLTAQQLRVDAAATAATAERDLGLAQLALHRALGGAWTAADARQAIPE